MVRLKAIVFECFDVGVLFQFLMVRLKEYTLEEFEESSEMFQFLMVRLKETTPEQIEQQDKKRFNSLWFD